MHEVKTKQDLRKHCEPGDILITYILDIAGWIGSIAFSIAAIPQAVEAYKKKVCHINGLFLTLWAVGEIFTLIYSIHIMAVPLIMNYVVNGISLAVIIYYNKLIE